MITPIRFSWQGMKIGIPISVSEKTWHDANNQEQDIPSQRPTFLLLTAIMLISLAYDANLFAGGLTSLGMDDRVARIAGSRLRVMAALMGAGLLLIGLSIWARNTRLHGVSHAHAAVLQSLSDQYAGRVEVRSGIGAIFSGEVAGLRMEVTVEPMQGGQAMVRALSPASSSLVFWPRGLAPKNANGGDGPVAQGPSWEAWSVESGSLQGVSVAPIEAAFFRAGVTQIRHDRYGIQMGMPNVPGDDLLERIEVGIQAAAALSRARK